MDARILNHIHAHMITKVQKPVKVTVIETVGKIVKVPVVWTHNGLKGVFLAFQTDDVQIYPGWKERLGYTGESSVRGMVGWPPIT